jgi:hypothetical protein
MGIGSPRATKHALLAVAVLSALLAAVLVEEPSGGVPGVGADAPGHSQGGVQATRRTSADTGASTVPTPVSSTTTTSTTTTSTAAFAPVVAPEPAPAPTGVISAGGGQLLLNGRRYRFVGVNAYEIGTQWTVNAGCGPELSDSQLNELFASLPPASLVRFWAFQGTMATNITTKHIDWAPLDRVFAAAAAHGQFLIPVLAGQSGSCDSGHWADAAWYDGGFADVFNDDPATTDGRGLTPLSYWGYLHAIVNRYQDSPALGMWEPMSEAEASTCPPQFEPSNCNGHQTCPDEQAAAQALRHFFDVVGTEIHALDPKHLVEAGFLGSGQCGTTWHDYASVGASPGIDVLSYHDYSDPGALVAGDQWNGLAVRFGQAASLGKPIIGGEEGINAGSACLSDSERSSDLAAKIEAQVAGGSSGALLWDYEPTVAGPCSYDIAPGDPVMAAIAKLSLG